jgi:hypothetical protein
MGIRYICTNEKCPSVKAGKPEVMPIDSCFEHPNLGKRQGKVCPYCFKPVRIK